MCAVAAVNGASVRAFRWFGASAPAPAPPVVAEPLKTQAQAGQAPADVKSLSDAEPTQQNEEDLSSDEGDDAKPGQKPPLIKKLEIILAELKERRDNIQHLEVTAAQERKMLDEGRQMHSLASTKKGKSTFDKQVKNSEEIFQDTTNMLVASKEEASSASKALLSEMAQSKKLIQKIQSEALALQKDLHHNSVSTMPAKSKKAEDDDDDEAEDDDQESM